MKLVRRGDWIIVHFIDFSAPTNLLLTFSSELSLDSLSGTCIFKISQAISFGSFKLFVYFYVHNISNVFYGTENNLISTR